MKVRAISFGFVALFVAVLCFARGGMTLEQLLEKDSIALSDLKETDLNIKQGHGPVMLADLDGKNEIWFWYKPGVVSALGLGKVVLIAKVGANDENNGEILWPKSKRGLDYGKELRSIYGK